MLATPSSSAPNFIANAAPNLISSPATMRFNDGRPTASSTPSRTQTFVVSTTLDLTSLRKFSFSIEEADMEVLLAMPTLCRVRSISALAENLKNGAQRRRANWPLTH
jgi:hypothetical protein